MRVHGNLRHWCWNFLKQMWASEIHRTSELDQWCDRLNIGPSRFASRNQPMADVSHPAIEVNLEACIPKVLAACGRAAKNKPTM
ncbi:MAG: hypothetical protein CM1200mP41_21410 [Gammaproteobacteria bacterium]|nr:MAG: hypothetical protein CM1200mP41_21410 [Gammaproteobacteria bacterium]